jgi:hypothetical protein
MTTLQKVFTKPGSPPDATTPRAPCIRRSTPRECAGNPVLELEALSLKLFQDLVRGPFVARLDAKDRTIGFVVTACQSSEQIIGFRKPRNQHGLVGKLVGQFVRNVHRGALPLQRGYSRSISNSSQE